MSNNKPTVARIYLNGDEAHTVAKVAESIGESSNWLMSKLVSQGIKAIEENGGKFEMPLRLSVVEASIPKRKAA